MQDENGASGCSARQRCSGKKLGKASRRGTKKGNRCEWQGVRRGEGAVIFFLGKYVRCDTRCDTRRCVDQMLGKLTVGS